MPKKIPPKDTPFATEVTAFLATHMTGKTVPLTWITHAFINERLTGLLPESESREFWLAGGYRFARELFREAAKKVTDPKKETPTLPLFPDLPRIQHYYSVERDADQFLVTPPEMTPDEILAKIDEYMIMRDGLIDHIDQLRRYYDRRISEGRDDEASADRRI